MENETPPIDPIEELKESCFRLLCTLQDIDSESPEWQKDFHTSMMKMDAAISTFKR